MGDIKTSLSPIALVEACISAVFCNMALTHPRRGFEFANPSAGVEVLFIQISAK
jgi:hypothetical protein